MKHALPWIALALSAVALTRSLFVSDAPARGAEPQVEIDLTPLVARLSALEDQSGRLRLELEAARLDAPTREGASTGGESPGGSGLSERLEAIEQAIVELRARPQLPELRLGATNAILDLRREARLAPEEAVLRARDLALSEAQRLEALRALRGAKLADGSDARLGALDDMIRMAQTSADGAVRADVWRQLSHVTDARLKGPLLDALAFDKDAKAREEAAETLADFLPDAQVEVALRNAAQNDASADVRRQAAYSLAGG